MGGRALLLRLGIKLRYVPVALPKLKGVIANELLCGFDGRFVVGAVQIDYLDEMAVAANNVNSVLGHRIRLSRRFRTWNRALRLCLCTFEQKPNSPGEGFADRKPHRKC
jgi:hypothetical protein